MSESPNEEVMLSIGNCPSCKTGPLGLRKCGSCSRVVLLCDECDAAYGQYAADAQVTYATEERMPCPLCGDSLWNLNARWAKVDDLTDEPEIQNLIARGAVTLERGKPFKRSSFK